MYLTLPPSMIIEKARKFALEVNIPINVFKATWCWFEKFQFENCLHSIYFYGERGNVELSNTELVTPLENLYSIINGYDPNYVYNMDGTDMYLLF